MRPAGWVEGRISSVSTPYLPNRGVVNADDVAVRMTRRGSGEGAESAGAALRKDKENTKTEQKKSGGSPKVKG